MKVLTISDLHGKDVWKKLIADNVFDLVIFLGDYVDSWNVLDIDILNNLKEIIAYKQAHMESCILLLGNHDVQYIWPDLEYRCSGYRPTMDVSLHTLFTEHLKLFQIAYEHLGGQYESCTHMWTHGGISKRWDKLFMNTIVGSFPDGWTFSDCLAGSLDHKPFRDVVFQIGPSAGGMRYDISGPLWARPDDLRAGAPFSEDIHQIVGHTPVPQIITYTKFQGITYPYASVTYTDTYDKDLTPYMLDL